jgi:hypothetical protein
MMKATVVRRRKSIERNMIFNDKEMYSLGQKTRDITSPQHSMRVERMKVRWR